MVSLSLIWIVTAGYFITGPARDAVKYCARNDCLHSCRLCGGRPREFRASLVLKATCVRLHRCRRPMAAALAVPIAGDEVA